MAERIFRTDNDYAVAVMRLVLGIVFFAHGAQKALAWFDGPGFDGTVDMFSQMGIGSRSPCSRSQLSFWEAWVLLLGCWRESRLSV